MIGRLTKTGYLIVLLLLPATNTAAHFGMVIPSNPLATNQQKTLNIELSFSHPFEMIGMDLEKPKSFFVMKDDGEKTDLLPSLSAATIIDHAGWQAEFRPKRPGVYLFGMEPQPYWEPAEDIFIIHYTKTIVAAFGADSGWDQPVGFPTEIMPLLRPFGNYGGNVFTGQVMLNGQPVPNTEVEVEYYNRQLLYTAPSDYHVTQTVRADENGIFSFSCPVSGWWGFSALNEADYTLKNPEGAAKGVELGAVLWVYMDEYLKK